MPTRGVLAKGVNKLYRRCGKLIRGWDADLGAAFIASARNTAEEDEPDDSVGAAWEELARANPRIRAVLLRLLAGGAWGALLEAHLPIFAAIIIKDSVRRRIPFGNLLASMAEPDEDSPDGGGGLPFGISADDLGAMAQQFARSFPGGFPGPAANGPAA